MTPTVSIVVPIYNVSKYLRECLDSIKTQTLKDIEIILVNDGSTDNSLEIMREYASKDPRIKIISKENSGYGDSMNKGMECAKGDYIGIVESDDYVDKNMFEDLYETAVANHCDIVKSDYYEFMTDGDQKYIHTVNDCDFYNTVVNSTFKQIFHFRMNTWTGIYKRSFIEQNGIKHNTSPGASFQDNGFWFQTLSLAERVMFVDRAYYHYRQDNPNSSINSNSKVFVMCDEYAYIERFIESNPHIKEKLYGTFLTKKYYNYMFIYNKLAEQYKIEFLKRFASEFAIHLNDPHFPKDFDPHEFGLLKRIVDDPTQFYYDDEIWRLEHEGISAMEKLIALKKSAYYKILHKVRLI